MNETSLRWQARIGGLKALSVAVLFIGGLCGLIQIENLQSASRNPGTPVEVTIEGIVNGQVETGKYVSVSGIAVYDAGYEETEDGRTVATYFFLVDDATGHVVVTKAREGTTAGRTTGVLTVKGMTHNTASELEGLIREDGPSLAAEGFATSSKVYLAEGETPPNITTTQVILLLLVVALLIGVVPLFFPSVVFAPKPITSTSMEPTAGPERAVVKAWGRFQQLKQVRPSIEIGKRRRKFQNAVANLIPLDHGNLMVYIHHVVRTTMYGITVGKREADWGVFFSPRNAVQVEPGVMYGWKDRVAIRFRYTGDAAKQEELIVSFDRGADQARFARLLREMGFRVGTGFGI